MGKNHFYYKYFYNLSLSHFYSQQEEKNILGNVLRYPSLALCMLIDGQHYQVYAPMNQYQ